VCVRVICPARLDQQHNRRLDSQGLPPGTTPLRLILPLALSSLLYFSQCCLLPSCTDMPDYCILRFLSRHSGGRSCRSSQHLLTSTCLIQNPNGHPFLVLKRQSERGDGACRNSHFEMKINPSGQNRGVIVLALYLIHRDNAHF
jgi:hypothetical protein